MSNLGHRHTQRPVSAKFWLLGIYLILVFLLGGGARSDIASLILLRPIGVIVCGIAALSLTSEHITRHRFILGFAGTLILIVALQLIPLPPSIWHLFPGRGIVAEVDRTAQLGVVWRPLTMVPHATWNSLFSLFVPLAALLLGIQLRDDERRRLAPLFVGIAILSVVVGLLQMVGGPGSPFYFYAVTNADAAVGLFANRNHHAIFLACIFPLLAFVASARSVTVQQARLKWIAAVSFGAILVPMLIITGSRAGLALGVLGLASVVFIFHSPDRDLSDRRKKPRLSTISISVGVAAVLILAVVTIVWNRAEAIYRLTDQDLRSDPRFESWGYIAKMAWSYFPFGSGSGSFADIFKIVEPDYLLAPTYLNHAHNDFLEVILTDGLVGVALTCIILVVILRRSFFVWRKMKIADQPPVAMARAATVIFANLLIGSVFDYPLRDPSLICFAVIAWLWLSDASQDRHA